MYFQWLAELSLPARQLWGAGKGARWGSRGWPAPLAFKDFQLFWSDGAAFPLTCAGWAWSDLPAVLCDPISTTLLDTKSKTAA